METRTDVITPTPIPVEAFVDGLRELSEGIITKQKIYEYLITYEVREKDLARYELWLPDRHTRNKIFRNEMLECMLICWPVGAITPLHGLVGNSCCIDLRLNLRPRPS